MSDEIDDEETPTPEQQAAMDRIFAALEGQADKWAVEVDLPEIIKNIRFKSPAIDAFLRLAFEEGYYRGFVDAKETAKIIYGGNDSHPHANVVGE